MRIYLAGRPEEGDEYVETKAKLERHGHDVMCNPLNDSLRWAIAELVTCDAICLMELWWADLQATQLQSVAAWLGLPYLDTDGERIPTSGLR